MICIIYYVLHNMIVSNDMILNKHMVAAVKVAADTRRTDEKYPYT